MSPDPARAKTTVAHLLHELKGIPDEAVLHVYFGANGLHVQAEWIGPDPAHDIGIATILRAPEAVVRFGATCTHQVDA